MSKSKVTMIDKGKMGTLVKFPHSLRWYMTHSIVCKKCGATDTDFGHPLCSTCHLGEVAAKQVKRMLAKRERRLAKIIRGA